MEAVSSMGHSSAPTAAVPPGSSKGMVVKAVIQAYSYVIIWMCISCAVILFNKVSSDLRGREEHPQCMGGSGKGGGVSRRRRPAVSLC